MDPHSECVTMRELPKSVPLIPHSVQRPTRECRNPDDGDQRTAGGPSTTQLIAHRAEQKRHTQSGLGVSPDSTLFLATCLPHRQLKWGGHTHDSSGRISVGIGRKEALPRWHPRIDP